LCIGPAIGLIFLLTNIDVALHLFIISKISCPW
jgi:hypothetical protein